MQYINSAVILFFAARAMGYAAYTFKERNIIGGISVLALTAGTLYMFAVSLMYIFK